MEAAPTFLARAAVRATAAIPKLAVEVAELRIHMQAKRADKPTTKRG